MDNKKTQNEKWITIKVKANIWLEIKAKAYKDGRKLNWYVEEALREYLNHENRSIGSKKD